jgi:hypothetical protein
VATGFDPRRAVQVTAPRYGTGSRIGGRLVLTSAHLLSARIGAPCTIRDSPDAGGGEWQATVAWLPDGWTETDQEPRLDVALVELQASAPASDPASLGRLPASDSALNLSFTLYGWPGWGRTRRADGSEVSGRRQVPGVIYLGDSSGEGLLVLEAGREGGDPARDASSAWEGASGAAIVCGGVVVAVQRQDQNPSRGGALEAVRLSRFRADPNLNRILVEAGVDVSWPVVSAEPSVGENLRVFVDQMRMTKGLEQLIATAVHEAYPTRAGMEELLARLDRDFGVLSSDNASDDTKVEQVVKRAGADQWLGSLVHTAAEVSPNDPALTKLAGQLAPIARHAGADPFDAHRLTGTFGLVNRRDLRRELRLMAEPNGPRILAVHGDRRTGKSHTAQFIQYLAHVLDTFSVVLVDLLELRDRIAPDPFTPREIAIELVSWVRYDGSLVPPPPDDRAWARWNGDFARGFTQVAMDDKRSWWIVLDGCTVLGGDRDTLDLLKQLLLVVSRSLDNFHVVLLDYLTGIPPTVYGHTRHEQVEPFGRKDVVQFVRDVCLEAGHLPHPDERAKVVRQMSRRVLKGLDATHDDFVTEVAQRLSTELAELPRANGAA